MAKGKRIQIATLERGLHEDVLRGDQFTMAATLEIMRGLYDDHRWPLQFPGYTKRSTATEAPLRAHVLSGLLVRPDNNTFLTVDAGALLAFVPAASSDDSSFELVDDPGVSDGSTLAFVANAAGSVRLDIVECSIIDTELENVTRGIFNTSTRVFDPTAVPKVSAPRLSYRIRQGVAGSGLPAMASGWLPLVVICHQPSTTSFADCDMWDVRPLIADRVQFGNPALNPGGTASKFEYRTVGRWRSSVANGLQGFAISQFDGYIAGGQLIASTAFPLADRGNFIESFATSYTPNRDPAFAMTANTMAHVVACFPGGLPRWVKYVDAGANGVGGLRVPEGPRGLLVLTNDQPLTSGYYAGVTLPAASGFTVDAPGVALASLPINNAGTNLPAVCVGSHVTFGDGPLAVLPGITGVGSNQVKWTFSPRAGVVIPAHARTVDVQFTITTASDGQFELLAKRDTGDADALFDQFFAFLSAGTKVTIRGIPLATALPWNADGGGLSAQTFLQLNTVAVASACVAHVVGYST